MPNLWWFNLFLLCWTTWTLKENYASLFAAAAAATMFLLKRQSCFWPAKEILPEDVSSDEEMLDLIASLKYIRVNYKHFSSPELSMYEALSQVLSLPKVKKNNNNNKNNKKMHTQQNIELTPLLHVSQVLESGQLRNSDQGLWRWRFSSRKLFAWRGLIVKQVNPSETCCTVPLQNTTELLARPGSLRMKDTSGNLLENKFT